MRTRSRGLGLAAACVVGTAGTLSAQETGVTLELGAARAYPPSGTDAAQASYGILGLRAERWNLSGSGFWAGVYGGRSLDAGASNWGSADIGGQMWTRISGPLDLGLGADAYAFTVSEPFVYKAVTGAMDGRLRLTVGRVHLLANAEGGGGRSVIEVMPHDTDRLGRNGLDRLPEDGTAVRRAEQDLWHYGGGPEVRLVGARTVGSVAGGVYRSPKGTYRQTTASVAGFLGPRHGVIWRVIVSGWRTPTGNEVTGGLIISFPLGGSWSARASGVRTEPSPLIRTTGGSRGGMLLRWQPIKWDAQPRSVYLLAETEDARTGATATARFKLEHPEANAVEIVGDFTSWEPLAMHRDDGDWVLSVRVAPGVYHFGFVVDGEWYLPDEGIPGRVSDEWGRDNGTLVVPDDRDGDER